jgi:hypothetical protein
MKRYRVVILRSTTYEMEATCTDEAFDIAFGPDQDDYEVDTETFDHTVEELEEVPA